MTDRCDHTTPDYFGRCLLCHERIETPSRWMLDKTRKASDPATAKSPVAVPQERHEP